MRLSPMQAARAARNKAFDVGYQKVIRPIDSETEYQPDECDIDLHTLMWRTPGGSLGLSHFIRQEKDV